MLRIVSLSGSQVLIIGLFSHTDTQTHTYTRCKAYTKFHKNPNFCQTFEPGKKGYKSLLLPSAIPFFFKKNITVHVPPP